MSKNNIATLSLDQIDQLKPLIERSRQKPYHFLPHESQSSLDSFWLDEIADVLRQGQGEVFVNVSGSDIAGMAVYTELRWETRIFGKRMGAVKYVVAHPDAPQKHEVLELLLDHIMDRAIFREIEFLLCKTYTDDVSTIHGLEKKGFLLMDTQLGYVYDFPRDPLPNIPDPPVPSGTTIRLAEQKDLPAMVNMVRLAFRNHFGRFHSDERISKEQALLVYEEWIRSSYAGYADWILVAEIDGVIAGCTIWKKASPREHSLETRLGHHIFGCVHPKHYGQGLFTALTYAGMKLLEARVDCIDGPTHINNYPVQRGLSKLRWRLCYARHAFHKWLVG